MCGTFVDGNDFLEVSSSCKCLIDKEFPCLRSTENDLAADLGATCARQVTFLRDRIDEEHEMLCLNWLKVGHVLDECVGELFDRLGISALVKQFWQDEPRIDGKYAVMRRDTGNKFLMDMVFRELHFQENEELGR